MTAGTSKRKWHSRTRAGCLTCRRRRIKCDEKKPACAHCERGPRECHYPPHVEQNEETIKSSASISTNSELVKLSSSAVVGLQSTEPKESFDFTQIDPKLVIESLAPPPYPFEPIYFPAVLIKSGLTPTTYSQALQLLHAPLSIAENSLCIPQSISPNGTHSELARFFLQYHRETITEAHYLRWYDYSKLCTVIMFTLAETLDALKHSMIAFSALIYSIKENQKAREIAFVYYSAALQGLRLLLDKPTMDMTDCFVAVATALQLSSFDRFFGDVEKCFRHLEGVARILQQVTNPAQLCSSAVGRSLLEWFMQFEIYCSLLKPYNLLLPYAWREEDVRIRHKLAIVEYPRLSENERKPRILDDLWPEFMLILSDLAYVVYNLQKLKTPNAALAIELRTKLACSDEKFDQFGNLPYVQEVLEPAPYPSSRPSKHVNCCPPPTFIPYTLQFPPAGILRTAIFGAKCYIQSVLRPLVYKACRSEAELPKENETYSIEICRTFAGIEDALGDYSDSCLPLFALLLLAIPTCTQELRLWLWYKFAHFEHLGLATFKNPLRESYDKLWQRADTSPEIRGASESISTQDESKDVAEA